MNNLNQTSLNGLKTLKPISIKWLTLAVSLALCSGIASADNSPVLPSAAPEPDVWTGFYGGINIGGVFNEASLSSNNLGFVNSAGTCNTDSGFSSFFPGVQLGYARQFDSKAVLGIEGDFTYNVQQSGNMNCTCLTANGIADHFVAKNRLQGSLRGRVGWAMDHRLLPYAFAGVSFADLGMSYGNEGGDSYSKNTTQAGWLAGAGLEWGFADNWSVRTEYSYTDYGKAVNMAVPSVYGLSDAGGGAHLDLNNHAIKVAVNYWF